MKYTQQLIEEAVERLEKEFVVEDSNGRQYFQSRTHNDGSVYERVRAFLIKELHLIASESVKMERERIANLGVIKLGIIKEQQ